MRLLILSLIVFLISPLSSAKGLTVTCGEPKGFAYYTKAEYLMHKDSGHVVKKHAGFRADGHHVLFTLTVDEKNNGDVLFKLHPAEPLKSVTSIGGIVTVRDAGDNGLNWIVLYPDEIGIYSLNISTMKMAWYKNTVGSSDEAWNGLFISDCSAI
jgi:hypothetical protein